MTLIETMARAIDFAPEGTAESMARAALAAIEAAGWRLVPVEPTEAMSEAYWDCDPVDGDNWINAPTVTDAWAAMLASAPKADE